MKLGDVIKEYRETHHMTMQQFADRAGLSKGYISLLENGRRFPEGATSAPSIKTFSRIASAMNISTDDLLGMMDHNQNVALVEESSAYDLSPVEMSLIDSFRELNAEGQEELMKHVSMMIASGLYIKNNQARLVEEA